MPAARHAYAHALRKLPIGSPFRWNNGFDNAPALTQDGLHVLPLLAEQVREPGARGERERAPLAVLGCARLEPYHAAPEVHLPPHESEHLALAPAGQVGEPRDRTQLVGQAGRNTLEVLVL